MSEPCSPSVLHLSRALAEAHLCAPSSPTEGLSKAIASLSLMTAARGNADEAREDPNRASSSSSTGQFSKDFPTYSLNETDNANSSCHGASQIEPILATSIQLPVVEAPISQRPPSSTRSQVNGFACPHCGHIFSMRRTRDLHKNRCAATC